MEYLKTGYLEEKVEELYEILSEQLQRNSEEINFKKFEISHGELYYKDVTSRTPLTSEGELKMVESIAKILGKKGFAKWVLIYLWVQYLHGSM